MPLPSFLNFLRPVGEVFKSPIAKGAAPATPPIVAPPAVAMPPLSPAKPSNLPISAPNPMAKTPPFMPTTPPGQAELPALPMTANPMFRLPQQTGRPDVPGMADAPRLATQPSLSGTPATANNQIPIPKTYNRFWEALKGAGYGALLGAQRSGGNPWAMLGGAGAGAIGVGMKPDGEALGALKYEAVDRPQEDQERQREYERQKMGNEILLGRAKAGTEAERQAELKVRAQTAKTREEREAAKAELDKEMQRSREKRENEKFAWEKTKPIAVGPNGVLNPQTGQIVGAKPQTERPPTPGEARTLMNDEAEARALEDARNDPEWGLRYMTPEQRKMLSTGKKMTVQRDGSNQPMMDADGKPVMIETPLTPGEQAALQEAYRKAKEDEIKQRKAYYQNQGISKKKTETRITSSPGIGKYAGIIPGLGTK